MVGRSVGRISPFIFGNEEQKIPLPIYLCTILHGLMGWLRARCPEGVRAPVRNSCSYARTMCMMQHLGQGRTRNEQPLDPHDLALVPREGRRKA